MSKVGYAGLVLVLAILGPCVLGYSSLDDLGSIGPGVVYIANSAGYLTFVPEFHLINGSSFVQPSVLLKHNQHITEGVSDQIDCVEMSFLMNPDNLYNWHQDVSVWCRKGSPSNFCGPKCYWHITWDGFFVGPSPTAPKQFVIGWKDGYN